MSWGRHTDRLPQGKYPRGHNVFSETLSAVNEAEKPKPMIKNTKAYWLLLIKKKKNLKNNTIIIKLQQMAFEHLVEDTFLILTPSLAQTDICGIT